ncbi:MAG: glutamine synthetase family protein [Candidatus Omnitrophica bacterium]|nr:glutamine synthetase family protein [Candidatus Omnitrophota bacterium]MDD5430183.1 glutamine synthetase family protein [Candidatus Omnitrophota bacterium]
MTKQDVLSIVKSKKVKFLRLWFTDVLGFLKSFDIPVEELSGAMRDGMGFDGSSIEGFSRIEESDMLVKPDPDTFQIIPWIKEDGPVARMFCDVVEPGGTPFEGDPRQVLKKNLAEARKMGYTFNVGPEPEYFYFRNVGGTEILDKGGYFDLTPMDIGQDLRRKTVLMLEKMGIEVEYWHHEVASSQHEIDLRYKNALLMADNVMTYRMVVKEVAMQSNFYATFMPKPVYGINGSGMHVHMSLFKGKKNAFFEPKDKLHLSPTAKYFVAGLLKHAREICSVCCQWVNSYKRLVPGYEAPVYVSWAQRNRSALVRVPVYKPGKEKATRIEMRNPDPACNPYLAFSVMLAAGLEGIKKKYPLAAPVKNNIYDMTEKERRQAGIESLPDDLFEAVKITEKSPLVRKALGDKVFEYFIRNKKDEWNEYRRQITKYELTKYLPIL